MEEIIHNRCGTCFKAVVDGKEVGVLQYSIDDGVMNVFHTFVEPEMRGKGIATRMTAAAEEFARKEGLRTVASCSFAASKLE